DDDTTELKRFMEIVPEDDDDDVTIEATPLSSKSPTTVDYKIYKEGKKSYFKIIRADGNSQNDLEDKGVASITTSSSSSRTISKHLFSSVVSSSATIAYTWSSNFYFLALSCSSSSPALLELPSFTFA
nr:hypothetical protein [Tanacetum cinerariifolium]